MVFSIFCMFVVHHSLVFLVSVAKWSQSQKPKAKRSHSRKPEANTNQIQQVLKPGFAVTEKG